MISGAQGFLLGVELVPFPCRKGSAEKGYAKKALQEFPLIIAEKWALDMVAMKFRGHLRLGNQSCSCALPFPARKVGPGHG
jgi:hypothetical protein